MGIEWGVRVFFVAGATGYTGEAVVREACGRGYNVVAHIRPGSPRLADLEGEYRRLGVRIDRTPWEPVALADSLAEIAPTVVFGLLGTTAARARAAARSGGPRADYDAVDVALTEMLLQAATGTGLGPRFLYMSAVGAHAPANAYLKARHRVEALVRESGLPWTVIRPSIVTGPGRREARRLERIAGRVGDVVLRMVGHIGFRGVRDAYRSIDAEPLARVVVDLAMDAGAVNRVISSVEIQERRGLPSL